MTACTGHRHVRARPVYPLLPLSVPSSAQFLVLEAGSYTVEVWRNGQRGCQTADCDIPPALCPEGQCVCAVVCVWVRNNAYR